MFRIRFPWIIFRIFSLSFSSQTLYQFFVMIAYVNMAGLRIKNKKRGIFRHPMFILDLRLISLLLKYPRLTLLSMCNLSFLWVTVFWMRLLYEAFPASRPHLRPASTRQHCWSCDVQLSWFPLSPKPILDKI